MFSPLGMTQTSWYDRDALMADGTPFTGLRSTAEDLVKVGQVILDRGAPLITDTTFMSALSEPGSADNPAWGRLWWNNNQDRFKVRGSDKIFDGPILPAAPADLVAARGLRGNHLSVSPSEQLIVSFTVKETGDINRRLERAAWEQISE